MSGTNNNNTSNQTQQQQSSWFPSISFFSGDASGNNQDASENNQDVSGNNQDVSGNNQDQQTSGSYYDYFSSFSSDASGNTTTSGNTTNNTSTSGSKPSKSSGKSYTSVGYQLLLFLIALLISVVAILLYFSFSGLLLFMCKLAQSNILPDKLDCYPYTNTESTFSSSEPIATNIFTQYEYSDNDTDDPVLMSMKLKFPHNNHNMKNLLLDSFREYKYSPSSNFLANYLIAILEQVIVFDYLAIKNVMYLLNSNIPECFIIAFGPILFSAIMGSVGGINLLVFGIVVFWNMTWLFRTNKNTSNTGQPEWSDVNFFQPLRYFIALLLVGGLVVAFFFLYKKLMFIPSIILVYCILTCFLYKATLNDKPVTALNIIINTMRYYKALIFVLLCIFMVVLSFLILGIVPGIFSILTMLLVFYGAIPINIFQSMQETGLSKDVPYDLAEKKCNGKSIIPSSSSGGFFSFLKF